ncbi:hypothetical protein ILYODFUR_011934 [Ilyodon furcidens]|uniref:Uncharacterized protein n=1 Tax=Ilyodon furcidens TaxID=33524 RepID=A0ABV0SKV9_9TELE
MPWSVLLPGSVEGKPGGSRGGVKGWKGEDGRVRADRPGVCAAPQPSLSVKCAEASPLCSVYASQLPSATAK